MKNEKLLPLFNEVKALFKEVEPSLKVVKDAPGGYEVAGEGEYEVTSEKTGKTTKKQDPYFGAILIQKNFLGLYLMCQYMAPDRFDESKYPNLMKILKGKSCFHVKELTPELKKEIKAALNLGLDVYREKGWAK